MKRMSTMAAVCVLLVGLVGTELVMSPSVALSAGCVKPCPLVCLLGSSAAAAAPPESRPETRLMRYPDISKDSVVFVYAGDLWVSSRTGGLARRRRYRVAG